MAHLNGDRRHDAKVGRRRWCAVRPEGPREGREALTSLWMAFTGICFIALVGTMVVPASDGAVPSRDPMENDRGETSTKTTIKPDAEKMAHRAEESASSRGPDHERRAAPRIRVEGHGNVAARHGAKSFGECLARLEGAFADQALGRASLSDGTRCTVDVAWRSPFRALLCDDPIPDRAAGSVDWDDAVSIGLRQWDVDPDSITVGDLVGRASRDGKDPPPWYRLPFIGMGEIIASFGASLVTMATTTMADVFLEKSIEENPYVFLFPMPLADRLLGSGTKEEGCAARPAAATGSATLDPQEIAVAGLAALVRETCGMRDDRRPFSVAIDRIASDVGWVEARVLVIARDGCPIRRAASTRDCIETGPLATSCPEGP